ncbi:hypothetical protein ABZ547_29030 [Streptomyces sparsogenes]|uniref:hypothetical protein n=1 Tax=Streptomyces sparsogenes TaxID=67365 RepID=UPI0033DAE634
MLGKVRPEQRLEVPDFLACDEREVRRGSVRSGDVAGNPVGNELRLRLGGGERPQCGWIVSTFGGCLRGGPYGGGVQLTSDYVLQRD